MQFLILSDSYRIPSQLGNSAACMYHARSLFRSGRLPFSLHNLDSLFRDGIIWISDKFLDRFYRLCFPGPLFLGASDY